jgi:lipoprotein-anchoring transpeptidase ErfK/SrfK
LTSGAAPGMVTPQGKFKLGPKMAAPRSTKYASLMPFWSTIRIPGYTFEYGNHGLVGESYLYRLGTPASHGCLRLSNKWIQTNGKRLNIGGAKWVYHHVPVGTPIHIFRRAVQPFAFESYSMWLARRS